MTDANTTTSEANKAGKRMAAGWREKLSAAVDNLKELFAWSGYEDGDGEDEDMQVKMLNEDGYLLVFKDTEGRDRWLSYSSNAFKDREGEIVSTDTLEMMVAYGDKSGDRGPLRMFHIPEADIGDCDFQGVQGRFLIESGTFRDTPLALAAKAYIETCPEELGVSIGFRHPVDALKDGVYHEGIITERSICPLIFAANPFTSFVKLKGESMDSTRSDWFKKAVGDDLATAILSRADAATKTLEGQVAFKDNAEVQAALATLKALAGSDDEKAALDTILLSFSKKADAPPPANEDDDEEADTKENAKAVTEALAPIAEAMEKMAKAVEGVAAEVKSITDRVAAVETATKTLPAGASAFRASTSPENTVTATEAERIKAALGNQPEQPASPVSDYVAQVLNGKVPAGA